MKVFDFVVVAALAVGIVAVVGYAVGVYEAHNACVALGYDSGRVTVVGDRVCHRYVWYDDAKLRRQPTR